MFKRFFKLFILLEVLFSTVAPLFIIFIVFMYLQDNQLFDSPLYVAAGALISVRVFFWVYKSIQDLLRIEDAEQNR